MRFVPRLQRRRSGLSRASKKIAGQGPDRVLTPHTCSRPTSSITTRTVPIAASTSPRPTDHPRPHRLHSARSPVRTSPLPLALSRIEGANAYAPRSYTLSERFLHAPGWPRWARLASTPHQDPGSRSLGVAQGRRAGCRNSGARLAYTPGRTDGPAVFVARDDSSMSSR